MSQADNTITVMGTVINGPTPSYVKDKNSKGLDEKAKLRVTYQVAVTSRKADTNQRFIPDVRSLGNQAEKDLKNIRAGDIVIVHGRIATRTKKRRRFFIVDPDSNQDDINLRLMEIDPNDDELDKKKYNIDNAFIFDDQCRVTEIQTNDVVYLSNIIANLPNDQLKRMVTPEVLAKALAIQARDEKERLKKEEYLKAKKEKEMAEAEARESE